MLNDMLNDFLKMWSNISWQNDVLPFIKDNVALSMFVLGTLLMIFHRLITRGRVSQAEIVYRWLAAITVGFTGIYNFVMQVFYPDLAAHVMGWTVSPFQFAVGIASLGFGLIALLSFKASLGFRLAAVIGNTCWMWGCASDHLYQMAVTNNYTMAINNSWLWMDLLTPLILMICVSRLKSEYAKS